MIAPGSKLAFWRALKPEAAASSLAKACGLENVAEREVCAAIDWLLAQQPRIETTLAKRHLRSKYLSGFDKQNNLGWLRCQRRAGRQNILRQLECRIGSQRGGVIAVLTAAGDHQKPEPDHLGEATHYLRLHSRIVD